MTQVDDVLLRPNLHGAHDVFDECVDAARRNEVLAADRAEHDVRVEMGGVVEARIAGAEVLEERRIIRPGVEEGAELEAAGHSALQRRAYSGYRFCN